MVKGLTKAQIISALSEAGDELVALVNTVAEGLGEPKESVQMTLCQEIGLFREVVLELWPINLRQGDLIDRLEKRKVEITVRNVVHWKKVGWIESSGRGWLNVSALGRDISGVVLVERFVEHEKELEKRVQDLQGQLVKAQETIDVLAKPLDREQNLKDELAQVRRKLQEYEAALQECRAELLRVRQNPEATQAPASQEVASPSKPIDGKSVKDLSGFNVIIFALYTVAPGKLTKDQIKALLADAGKTYRNENSLIVALCPAGSKGMICSEGKKGHKFYWLSPKGMEHGERLSKDYGLQVFSKGRELKPDPPPPPPPPPAEPPKPVETGPYGLKPDTTGYVDLTEDHCLVLERTTKGRNPSWQAYFKAKDVSGKDEWVWWGLTNLDDNAVPPQPLLGHILKFGRLPEEVRLPGKVCTFSFEKHFIDFNPNEKPNGRILEYVMRRGKLPPVEAQRG